MSIEFKIEQQKLSQLRVIVWNSYIRKLLIGILEIRPTILIPPGFFRNDAPAYSRRSYRQGMNH